MTGMAVRLTPFIAVLPLVLFVVYSQFETDLYRRMLVGSVAAAPVLLAFAVLRTWMNPILLGTYLFWIVLLVAFALEPAWLLPILGALREAGIFIAMALAALFLTFASSAGAIGQEGSRGAVLLASGIMIAAILLALIPGLHFRGDETRAIVWPSIALFTLQWVLAWRVRREKPAS